MSDEITGIEWQNIDRLWGCTGCAGFGLSQNWVNQIRSSAQITFSLLSLTAAVVNILKTVVNGKKTHVFWRWIVVKNMQTRSLQVYNSDFAFADQSHSEKEKVLVWQVWLEQMSS